MITILFIACAVFFAVWAVTALMLDKIKAEYRVLEREHFTLRTTVSRLETDHARERKVSDSLRDSVTTVKIREVVLKRSLEMLAQADIGMAKFALRTVYGDEDEDR